MLSFDCVPDLSSDQYSISPIITNSPAEFWPLDLLNVSSNVAFAKSIKRRPKSPPTHMRWACRSGIKVVTSLSFNGLFELDESQAGSQASLIRS